MTEARVSVAGETVAEIGRGMVVLLGITQADSLVISGKVASKVAGLRIFEDAEGRMNLGMREAGGAVLCISQFTLYGDVRRGRRPSFDSAARPEFAEPLYDAFCAAIERAGIRCERGRFGARMEVHLVNDGPVTILVDSEALDAPRDP